MLALLSALILALAGASAPAPAAGNLTLPKVLGSHMILQRAPKKAAVWGWASPGGKITVTLTGSRRCRARRTPAALGRSCYRRSAWRAAWARILPSAVPTGASRR
jgi:hypothetical protein